MNPTSVRRAAIAALVFLLAAAPARAQSRDDPLLTITMHGGWLTGPSLWNLPAQPAAVAGEPMDTVDLGRVFKPGFSIGVGATLFRSPHIGISADISFLGITTEGRCSGPAVWSYDPVSANRQACENLQGRAIRTNAVAVQGGATWRPVAQGRIQPYVKLLGGVGVLSNSFVDAWSTIAVPTTDTTQSPFPVREFLSDRDHRVLTWVATGSIGVTLEMSPGSLLRFEAQDLLISLPIVTGPANPQGLFPSPALGNRIFHLPGFTIGLDLVLERSQRPRRY